MKKQVFVWGLMCLLGMVSVVGVQAQRQPVNAEPEAPGKAGSGTGVSGTGVPPVALTSVPTAGVSLPRLIKFTGILKDRLGQPRSGIVGATFALYQDQQGGAPLWLEVQNLELDEQGRYSVLLGATQTGGLPLELFAAGRARWLGVQVQGEEESPEALGRILLVSVPYALKAADAETLGGKPASAFVLAEEAKSGGTGVSGTGVSGTGVSGTGVSGTGVSPVALTSGTGPTKEQVTGTGTTNFLAKFTSTGPNPVVGNSLLFDDGTKVGLGTITPAVPLQINVANPFTGTSIVSSALTTGSVDIVSTDLQGADIGPLLALGGNRASTGQNLGVFGGIRGAKENSTVGNNSGYLGFYTLRSGVALAERMRITSDGNVGIGTTTPLTKLHVVGLGLVEHPTFPSVYFRVANNPVNFRLWRWSAGGTLFQIQALDDADTAATGALVIERNANTIVDVSFPTGNVGIGTAAPTQKLELVGKLKLSGAGNGIIFPDATTQTTAAISPAAADTRYVFKAGDTMTGNLSLPNLTATGSISGATGSFSGSTALGTGVLSVTQSGTGDGIVASTGSTSGIGVFGQATSISGIIFGVRGITPSTSFGAAGVRGDATATTGTIFGVQGLATASPGGIGVQGQGGTIGVEGIVASTTGFAVGVSGAATLNPIGVGVRGDGGLIGVKGTVSTSAGTAGVFDHLSGGKILSGQVVGTEKFSVDGSGNVRANAYLDLNGNPIVGGGGIADVTGTPPIAVTSPTASTRLVSLNPITDANVAVGAAIAPAKIAGTAATLGANSFTGAQTFTTGSFSGSGTPAISITQTFGPAVRVQGVQGAQTLGLDIMGTTNGVRSRTVTFAIDATATDPGGIAVLAIAGVPGSPGGAIAVFGTTRAPDGIGVQADNQAGGVALKAAGGPSSNLPGGIGTVLIQNDSGGNILVGRSGPLAGEKFRVDGLGNVRANAYLDLLGNPIVGTGDITAVRTQAGSGLTGGVEFGDAVLSLVTSCGSGQVLKWNGSAWGCDTDLTGAGGGVTSITAGTGLLGGTITTSGTISLDSTFTDGRYVNTTGDSMSASDAVNPILLVTNSSGTAVLGRRPGAGTSQSGHAGIKGIDFNSFGTVSGVVGEVFSADGSGVRGVGNGSGYGVTGVSDSGFAVRGLSLTSAGTPGLFDNTAGGDILVGKASGVNRFRVDGGGGVRTTGNFQATSPGTGIILRSLNGAVCKLLGIDNAGNIVLTNLACPAVP